MYITYSPPTREGQTLEALLIGLSREDITRLTQKPGEDGAIHIEPGTPGDILLPPGWKILIVFGETNNDIVETIRANQRPSPTKAQYEMAVRICAEAGVDPRKSWDELSPEAQAVMAKQMPLINAYLAAHKPRRK